MRIASSVHQALCDVLKQASERRLSGTKGLGQRSAGLSCLTKELVDEACSAYFL